MIWEMFAGGNIGLKGASSVPVGGCSLTLITCTYITLERVQELMMLDWLSSYLWYCHLDLKLCHWKSVGTDGGDDHHHYMGSRNILREPLQNREQCTTLQLMSCLYHDIDT